MPFASAWTDYADQYFCDTVVMNTWGQKNYDECLASVDSGLQQQYCGMLPAEQQAACLSANGTVAPAIMPNLIGDGNLQSMGSCPIERAPGKDYLCAKRDDAIKSAVYWKGQAMKATSKCQRMYFFCVAANYYAQTYNPFNQVLNVDPACKQRIESKIEFNLKTNQTGWGAGEVCLFDYVQTKTGGNIKAAQSQQMMINDRTIRSIVENLTQEARSIYTLPLAKTAQSTSTTLATTTTTMPASVAKTYCEIDDDCVAAQSDCCGCNAGGENIAIAKSYKDKWAQELAAKCKDKACLAVMSEHISCKSTPICMDNVCTLVVQDKTEPTTTTSTTQTTLAPVTTTQPPTTTIAAATTSTTIAKASGSGTSIAIYAVAFLLLVGGAYFIFTNIGKMSGADEKPSMKGLRSLGDGKHARIQSSGPSRLSAAGGSQSTRHHEHRHREHSE